MVEEAGLNSPRAKAMLVGTAKDIMKRMDYNLRRLQVSPYDPGKKGTGDLKRSVHWTVFNATGGDEATIQFYVQNVASFVELAVQGMRRNGRFVKSGWTVAKTGLPQRIQAVDYGGIPVNRTNSSGAVLKRKAKPFLAGEMRVHGRMLFDRLTKDYGYVGNMLLASSIVPDLVKVTGGYASYYRDAANGNNYQMVRREDRQGNKTHWAPRHSLHDRQQMSIGDLRIIISRRGFNITDFE